MRRGVVEDRVLAWLRTHAIDLGIEREDEFALDDRRDENEREPAPAGQEALLGGDFCPDHDNAHVFFEVGDYPVRKLVTRVVALILLVIFLIPFYYTLKTLYLSPPIEAQEGG